MRTKIIYDKEALPFVLEILGYKEKEGLVSDNDGREICVDDINGFSNSRIISKKDLTNIKIKQQK